MCDRDGKMVRTISTCSVRAQSSWAGRPTKLKGILDKRYARAQLPDGKLGELISTGVTSAKACPRGRRFFWGGGSLLGLLCISA